MVKELYALSMIVEFMNNLSDFTELVNKDPFYDI